VLSKTQNIRGARVLSQRTNPGLMAIAIWDYNDAEKSEKT
jgi:hypothetical protein